MSSVRRFRVRSVVLVALALFGCVAAVDDGADGASAPADGVGESSHALSVTSVTAGNVSSELAPVIDDVDLSIDPTETQISSSTCRRVCACCKNNGNRFCCSHCRFCSGPIGVSDGVFAP